jgi:hypothetical protein
MTDEPMTSSAERGNKIRSAFVGMIFESTLLVTRWIDLADF